MVEIVLMFRADAMANNGITLCSGGILSFWFVFPFTTSLQAPCS
jgi:hypothetical protein